MRPPPHFLAGYYTLWTMYQFHNIDYFSVFTFVIPFVLIGVGKGFLAWEKWMTKRGH